MEPAEPTRTAPSWSMGTRRHPGHAHPGRWVWGLGLLVALVALVTLGAPRGVAEAPAEAPTVRHVIHISVDGLRGDLLQRMLRDDRKETYTHFARLVREGASTFEARTDPGITVTLPNHTCMLTGLPALASPDGVDSTFHGYFRNSRPRDGETVHNRGNPRRHYVPSVFDVVHDHGLSTALYATKRKFVLFDRSWDGEHGARDRLPPDDGRDKIDVYKGPRAKLHASDPIQVKLLADLERDPPSYAFVHYCDPDAVGHAMGWGSREWQRAVARVDRYLGELLQRIDTDPRLRGHTAIVLTSDHGGSGKDHRDIEDPANFTIPFLVWGPGVAAGADLYALNASVRRRPGRTEQPGPTATPPPIRNGESGNLALDLLGLPAVPGSMLDARHDLRVHAEVAQRARRP